MSAIVSYDDAGSGQSRDLRYVRIIDAASRNAFLDQKLEERRPGVHRQLLYPEHHKDFVQEAPSLLRLQTISDGEARRDGIELQTAVPGRYGVA